MTELWDKVSNSNCDLDCTQGSNIMAKGDQVVLAVKAFKCSDGTCAGARTMIAIDNIFGSITCANDAANCVLDGQSGRGLIWVRNTFNEKMTLRAITFKDGETDSGGGLYISNGGIVDVVLCAFNNCRATSSGYGGGAIYLLHSSTTVNLYSTRLTGNTADSGNGNDIYRQGGTITIHDTCPSPYSSNTPTQGKKRMRRGVVTPVEPFNREDASPYINNRPHDTCPQSLFNQTLPSTCLAPFTALSTHTLHATTSAPTEVRRSKERSDKVTTATFPTGTCTLS